MIRAAVSSAPKRACSRELLGTVSAARSDAAANRPGFPAYSAAPKTHFDFDGGRSLKKRVTKPIRSATLKKAENMGVPSARAWRDILLTTDEAGAAVKMTGERVRQLTKANWIRKHDRNRYRLGDVIDGELAYRDDQAKRLAAETEGSKLAASRRRLVDLRIAQEENRLVEADDVHALVTEIVGGFVSELHGVPAGASRDPAVREAIEEVLNGAIDRCRARFEKLGADLRSGRGVVTDEAALANGSDF